MKATNKVEVATIANRVKVYRSVVESSLVAVEPKYDKRGDLLGMSLSYKVRGYDDVAKHFIYDKDDNVLCSIAAIALKDTSEYGDNYHTNPALYASVQPGMKGFTILKGLLYRDCYVYEYDGCNKGVFVRTHRVANDQTVRLIPFRTKTTSSEWSNDNGLVLTQSYNTVTRKKVYARVFVEWQENRILGYLHDVFSFVPKGHPITEPVNHATFMEERNIVRLYHESKYENVNE